MANAFNILDTSVPTESLTGTDVMQTLSVNGLSILTIGTSNQSNDFELPAPFLGAVKTVLVINNTTSVELTINSQTTAAANTFFGTSFNECAISAASTGSPGGVPAGTLRLGLIGVSTALWQAGMIPPAAWMICVGLGLYVGYVPYGCVLFDRLIAAVGSVATAGFLIYVTDAFGYLGSVALVLYKNFGQSDLSWLEFFVGFSWVTTVVCSVCFIISTVYFAVRTRRPTDFKPKVSAAV